MRRAVADIGYDSPTPIQTKALPPALAGRDVLGCAQTGTGKTAAFALPVLQRLAAGEIRKKGGKRVIRALVLTPTRELAAQIYESFEAYGKYLPVETAVIVGGVSRSRHRRVLEQGADILVATPGRLLEYTGERLIDISGVEIFVLDEADRMLDMGFIHDVERVIRMLPRARQTMFFTATMPPEVGKLAETLLRDPVRIAADRVSSSAELVDQYVMFADKASKTDQLIDLLVRYGSMTGVLVFTRTKYGADKLARKLNKAGESAASIHGDKSQGAREKALESFRNGTVRVLVATDIAARGIDLDNITHVINYELPNVPETYVHRIGRTGRAGRHGKAISLCDESERGYLADIEKLIRKKTDRHRRLTRFLASGGAQAAKTRSYGRAHAKSSEKVCNYDYSRKRHIGRDKKIGGTAHAAPPLCVARLFVGRVVVEYPRNARAMLILYITKWCKSTVLHHLVV